MPTIQDNAAFQRVTVDYAIKDISRITWYMKRSFIDPEPWVFQLQVNRNRGETNDWSNVGLPVVDTFFSLDDTQRLYGKQLRAVYRVKLTTSVGTYYSELAQVLGELSKRQWLQARAIIRRAQLAPRQLGTAHGYLLKRKLRDTVCTVCTDALTGGITNSDCATCLGTGRVDGYWNAVPSPLFDLSPETHFSHQDPRHVEGTVNEIKVQATAIGIPLINSKDVWIHASSDRRYIVQQVQTTGEIGHVPIIVKLGLELVPFTDIVYDIEVGE